MGGGEGAQDTVELVDELAVLARASQRLLVKEIRPWAEFFGPVSVPKWTQVDVEKRVLANVSFFKSNYLLLCGVCSAFYIITSPGLLVVLLLVAVMFLSVFLSRRRPLVVGDFTIGTREKLIGATIGSTLLLSVTGYVFSLQYSLMLGGIVCILHAVLRPPVARAVRGGGGLRLEGDGEDLEGGGKVGMGGRAGHVNVNMRLRSRPGGGRDESGGAAGRPWTGTGLHPPNNESPYVPAVPMTDPGLNTSAGGGRGHLAQS